MTQQTLFRTVITFSSPRTNKALPKNNQNHPPHHTCVVCVGKRRLYAPILKPSSCPAKALAPVENSLRVLCFFFASHETTSTTSFCGCCNETMTRCASPWRMTRRMCARARLLHAVKTHVARNVFFFTFCASTPFGVCDNKTADGRNKKLHTHTHCGEWWTRICVCCALVVATGYASHLASRCIAAFPQEVSVSVEATVERRRRTRRKAAWNCTNFAFKGHVAWCDAARSLPRIVVSI